MTDEELQSKLVDTVNDYMLDLGFTDEMYEIKTYATRVYCEVFNIPPDGVKFVIADLKKSNFSNILNAVKHMYLPQQYSLIFTFKED